MAEHKGQLEPTWKARLGGEFKKTYMCELRSFLHSEKQAKKVIYPKGTEYFNAFNTTPFEKVKIVVLGQDPYHGPHQAHGLSFSVRPGVQVPPSLKNIFKELKQDLHIKGFEHGYLQSWAEQGVLLLNAVLTVERAKAAAHQKKGWEVFTDKAIEKLNSERSHLVFMLWGSYAQKKGEFIDGNRHLVLKAPHPSPLSAHRGFLGCRHFSKANAYLKENGMQPINWALPSLKRLVE